MLVHADQIHAVDAIVVVKHVLGHILDLEPQVKIIVARLHIALGDHAEQFLNAKLHERIVERKIEDRFVHPIALKTSHMDLHRPAAIAGKDHPTRQLISLVIGRDTVMQLRHELDLRCLRDQSYRVDIVDPDHASTQAPF